MKEQVVWITGASSGIGEELAQQYARRGSKVILSARRVSELERVKASCEQPENVAVVPFDLTAFDSLEDKVKEALHCFGSIDLLINNGGVSQRSLIIETNFDVYKRLMDINYLGTVALTKALLPYFIEKQKGSVVTNLLWHNSGPPKSKNCPKQSIKFPLKRTTSKMAAWSLTFCGKIQAPQHKNSQTKIENFHRKK